MRGRQRNETLMKRQSLEEEDWDRIEFALSKFTHNPEFTATLEKVRSLRKELPGPD